MRKARPEDRIDHNVCTFELLLNHVSTGINFYTKRSGLFRLQGSSLRWLGFYFGRRSFRSQNHIVAPRRKIFGSYPAIAAIIARPCQHYNI